MSIPHAVLAIGHGTRDPLGVAQFHEAIRCLSALLPDWRVESAFLEMQPPTIEVGVAKLHAVGVRDFVALPVLLFAAGHAKEDIPRELFSATEKHGMTAKMASPLGCHPLLLKQSLLRLEEALAAEAAQGKVWSREELTLLLVGRGSRDDSATAETVRYAQLLAKLAGIPRAEAAFIAMASPRLDERLPQLISTGSPLLIQPHLLFHGELMQSVAQRVTAASSSATSPVIMAPYLGHDLLTSREGNHYISAALAEICKLSAETG